MSKTGKSEKGLFGDYTHYDADGQRTGSSSPNFFGGYTHYDASGHKIGFSDEGFFGGFTNYDEDGHKIGTSEPNLFGGYTNYDLNGKKIGTSAPGLFGGYSHDSDGCYIATCIYGSYDCPQVWTLRRFRDSILGATWYGRTFIRVYYTVSPILVKWFGKTEGFRHFWRGKLDRIVTSLQKRGIKDTPYRDKQWRKKK